MAFPWVAQETFDDGTRGNFTDETDLSSILDFPNYQQLAAQGLHPWQGSHALRARLNGTAVAHIVDSSRFDLTAGQTLHVWFPLLVGADVTLADGNAVILFAMQSPGPVNEVVFGVRNNGGVYELFAGEAAANRTLAITRSNKRWYQIELSMTIAAATGTLDWYVDGGQVGTQIEGMAQADVVQAVLGPTSGTAAGNVGTILIGGIIADDARVYPRERFPKDTLWITRDINALIGPCCIDDVILTGTGTDAVLTILDADIYSSTGIAFSREPAVYVRNITASDNSPGLNVKRELKNGAYVQLTGTNPQAWISMSYGDVVKSSANYVDRGLKRNGLV